MSDRKYSLASVMDYDAITDEEVDNDFSRRKRIEDLEVSRHGNVGNSGTYEYEDGPDSEVELEEEIVGQNFPPEGSGQNFVFDKFINDFEAREEKRRIEQKKLKEQDESYGRKLNKRYSDHPHNRMTINKD